MSAENVLRVQTLWKAFDNQGLEAVLRIADDDVQWIPGGGNGQHYRGHAGLREFMRDREAAGPIDAEAFSFFDYGDCVLVYGKVRRPSEEGGDERRLFWVYSFRDDCLVRFEAFDDHEAAVRAASAGRRGAGA
jgi:ketosteroid isomerase-like protein